MRSNSSASKPETVRIRVNDDPLTVAAGTVLAAAIAQAGLSAFRRSVAGQPRGPLCGMGTCMECCVTINGRPHSRSCQVLCEEGMEVRTDEITQTDQDHSIKCKASPP